MAKRMTWLAAAELVLNESPCPLTAAEIAREVLARGLVTRHGHTPEYSIQGAISKDMRDGRQQASPIVVLPSGNRLTYWLRSKVNNATPSAPPRQL